MNLQKQALKIAEQCLDEMYTKSNPPISWKEYVKKYSNTKTEGYKQHALDVGECDKIWEKYENKIKAPYRSAFNMYILNYSPVSEEVKNVETK